MSNFVLIGPGAVRCAPCVYGPNTIMGSAVVVVNNPSGCPFYGGCGGCCVICIARRAILCSGVLKVTDSKMLLSLQFVLESRLFHPLRRGPLPPHPRRPPPRRLRRRPPRHPQAPRHRPPPFPAPCSSSSAAAAAAVKTGDVEEEEEGTLLSVCVCCSSACSRRGRGGAEMWW